MPNNPAKYEVLIKHYLFSVMEQNGEKKIFVILYRSCHIALLASLCSQLLQQTKAFRSAREKD